MAGVAFDPREKKWMNAFMKYLGGDFDADGKRDVASGHQGMSWAYWNWGFDDCQRGLFTDVKFSKVDAAKIKVLKPHQFPRY